jgi:beta-phosphoglucomutase
MDLHDVRLTGIVFDFNGTLVWDNKFHEEAWIQFAREFGHTIDHDSYYREICLLHPETFVLARGVEQLLDDLKYRGVPMNIATASEIDNVEFFIQYFQLERWFEPEKIVYDDGKIPNKPEPDIYLHAAERICRTSDQIVIVEDSVAGVKAAKTAGCRYVVVTGEKTVQHQVFQSMGGIAQIISDFSEIDRALFA